MADESVPEGLADHLGKYRRIHLTWKAARQPLGLIAVQTLVVLVTHLLGWSLPPAAFVLVAAGVVWIFALWVANNGDSVLDAVGVWTPGPRDRIAWGDITAVEPVDDSDGWVRVTGTDGRWVLMTTLPPEVVAALVETYPSPADEGKTAVRTSGDAGSSPAWTTQRTPC